jgi:hypothetical protein
MKFSKVLEMMVKNCENKITPKTSDPIIDFYILYMKHSVFLREYWILASEP